MTQKNTARTPQRPQAGPTQLEQAWQADKLLATASRPGRARSEEGAKMPLNSNSTVLGLMPARGGSKRIPRKNLAEFHGAPIMTYPLRAALQSGIFKRLHVSSDDSEIRAVARTVGADADPERPAALSDDFTGLLPVARWALQHFLNEGQRFDSVFILYPCAPTLTVKDLRGAYDVFQSHGGQRNLLTIGRVPVPAEWLYRRTTDGALVPLHPGGAFIRSQDLEPAYFETGTFTIFSAEFLLKNATIEDDSRYVGFELPLWKSIDIDHPEDLERAKEVYLQHRADIEGDNQA